MNIRIKLGTRLYLLMILPFLATQPTQAQMPEQSLKAFTAEYRLEKNSVTIAKISMNLTEKNDRWYYQTLAKPKGFAALFSRDHIEQYSIVKTNDRLIVPVEYRLSTQSQISSEIHYGKTSAAAFHNGEKTTITLSQPHYDEQSLQLAIANDLRYGKAIQQYSIIDGLSSKTYQFKNQGLEIIKCDLGSFKTIKLVRSSSSRTTISWLAPELDYLPILVMQYKNEKLKSTMTLSSHRFL